MNGAFNPCGGARMPAPAEQQSHPSPAPTGFPGPNCHEPLTFYPSPFLPQPTSIVLPSAQTAGLDPWNAKWPNGTHLPLTPCTPHTP
jgi:hypothetical protein